MTTAGWTLDTLKDHFDDMRRADKEAVTTALNAAEKAVAAAMAASEKAILKAETASDKRAEASNEIRAAMIDQQKTFANKEQTDMRLKLLEDALAASRGKTQGVGMLAGVIVSVITVIGVVLAIIFRFVPAPGS